MRHALPVAVAAAVAAISGCLAGCTGGSPQASAAAPAAPSAAASGASSGPSRLTWQSCSVQGAPLQCASLQVPSTTATRTAGRSRWPCPEVPATAPADQRQGVLLVNPGGPGGRRPEPGRDRGPGPEPGRRVRVRHHRLRHPGDRRLGAVAALRPVVLLPGPARLHPDLRGGGAGEHRPREDVRGGLREAVRLAAAVHDHREHRPGHGLDPGRPGAAADQLLRVLLRDLHRPGLRDPVPAPGAADGAGQHRRPDRRLVDRQHRAGLRVPGPDPGVLRLGGPVRQRLPPRLHRRAGEPELVPGARGPGGASHPGPVRPPADRPGRVRRHVPDRRLRQRRTGRAWPPRSPPT